MNLHSLVIAIAMIVVNSQNAFAQNEKTPKAVLVIVDGIPADLLESVATPYIDIISRTGGYTRAYHGGERSGYSQTPTISAVGYNSMLTGTWANKHNVWDNAIEAPNYNYWTIFRALKESKAQSKLGIYSTWTDNRTKLIGAGLQQTNGLTIDYQFDGYELDTIRFPHDRHSRYIHLIDEEVTKQASVSIRDDGPDLSWVYLQYTDDMGHAYGDSEQMVDGIKKADRQIGEIYNAILYREQNFEEDWLIVITTDHGRDIATGLSHGGQSDRERTIWISTNSRRLNKHFFAHTPAIVDIFPSVANHLQVALNKTQQYELDGVPFIGEVSIADPRAAVEDGTLIVSWTPFTNKGSVKVLVSATDYFKDQGVGTPDTYQVLGEFSVGERSARISLPPNLKRSKLLKVVIEGEHNVLNRIIFR